MVTCSFLYLGLIVIVESPFISLDQISKKKIDPIKLEFWILDILILF